MNYLVKETGKIVTFPLVCGWRCERMGEDGEEEERGKGRMGEDGREEERGKGRIRRMRREGEGKKKW